MVILRHIILIRLVLEVTSGTGREREREGTGSPVGTDHNLYSGRFTNFHNIIEGRTECLRSHVLFAFTLVHKSLIWTRIVTLC